MTIPKPNTPFVCSWSGGKDSCLALHRALAAGARPVALLTMMAEGGRRSRSHGLSMDVLQAQAASLGIPLVTHSASWEAYDRAFVAALRELREAGAEAAVFGDIDLAEHRQWVERACAAAGMEAHLPLWQMPRAQVVEELLSLGYRATIIATREGEMDNRFLGRTLTAGLLHELEGLGIDPCGEGGEYHTVVTDGPLFGHPLEWAAGQRSLHAGCWVLDGEVISVCNRNRGGYHMSLLERTIGAIRPLDVAAMDAARARHGALTKPAGSLGRLEALSIQVAGITGQVRPRLPEKAVIVCAGDHGVTAQGVSAFPQEVTRQMVANFLAGGAAINVLARHVGARVVVVDAGVASRLEPQPGLMIKKVAPGTADMTQGPAMSREQAVAAVEAGIEALEDELARGLGIVATGDMGIGNTTPSSAIVAAITGRPVAEVTGRGTGIDDGQLAHKVGVIERALAVNQPRPDDPLDVLAKVGGFEIGAIAGVVLGAAARRIPVVVDGFISTAGALIAGDLAPLARDYMISAHASVEIGHRAALEYLGLRPCLDFDMRLGEGTGAALAMGVVEAACKILDEMATFESARIAKGPLA